MPMVMGKGQGRGEGEGKGRAIVESKCNSSSTWVLKAQIHKACNDNKAI